MNQGLGNSVKETEKLEELIFDQKETIIDIATSEKHGVALSRTSKVYFWGRSYNGENTIFGSNTLTTPTLIDFDNDPWLKENGYGNIIWSRVYCNKYSSLLLSDDKGLIFGKLATRLNENHMKGLLSASGQKNFCHVFGIKGIESGILQDNNFVALDLYGDLFYFEENLFKKYETEYKFKHISGMRQNIYAFTDQKLLIFDFGNISLKGCSEVLVYNFKFSVESIFNDISLYTNSNSLCLNIEEAKCNTLQVTTLQGEPEEQSVEEHHDKRFIENDLGFNIELYVEKLEKENVDNTFLLAAKQKEVFSGAILNNPFDHISGDLDLNSIDMNFSQIKQAIDITRAKSPSRMFVSKKPFSDLNTSFGKEKKSIGGYNRKLMNNSNYQQAPVISANETNLADRINSLMKSDFLDASQMSNRNIRSSAAKKRVRGTSGQKPENFDESFKKILNTVDKFASDHFYKKDVEYYPRFNQNDKYIDNSQSSKQNNEIFSTNAFIDKHFKKINHEHKRYLSPVNQEPLNHTALHLDLSDSRKKNSSRQVCLSSGRKNKSEIDINFDRTKPDVVLRNKQPPLRVDKIQDIEVKVPELEETFKTQISNYRLIESDKEKALSRVQNFESRLKNSMKNIEMRYVTKKSVVDNTKYEKTVNFNREIFIEDPQAKNVDSRLTNLFNQWGEPDNTKTTNLQSRISNIKTLLSKTQPPKSNNDQSNNVFADDYQKTKLNKNLFETRNNDQVLLDEDDIMATDENYLKLKNSGNLLQDFRNMKIGLNIRDFQNFDVDNAVDYPGLNINTSDLSPSNIKDLRYKQDIIRSTNSSNNMLKYKTRLHADTKDQNFKGESIDYELSDGDMSNIRSSPKMYKEQLANQQSQIRRSDNNLSLQSDQNIRNYYTINDKLKNGTYMQSQPNMQIDPSMNNIENGGRNKLNTENTMVYEDDINYENVYDNSHLDVGNSQNIKTSYDKNSSVVFETFVKKIDFVLKCRKADVYSTFFQNLYDNYQICEYNATENAHEFVRNLSCDLAHIYKFDAKDMLKRFIVFDNVCNWVSNFRLCYLAKMFVNVQHQNLVFDKNADLSLNKMCINLERFGSQKQNKLKTKAFETLIKFGYQNLKKEQLMMVLFEKRLQEEKEFLLRKGKEFFNIMGKINKLTKMTVISEAFLGNMVNNYLQKVNENAPKRGKILL